MENKPMSHIGAMVASFVEWKKDRQPKNMFKSKGSSEDSMGVCQAQSA
jgi:hypothetical protein